MARRVDETDARAYVERSARNLIGDLRDLERLAGPDRWELPRSRMDALGLAPDGFDRDDAEEAIGQMPLAVEATTTFEVVLGVGGPDRRLCFECDGSPADWQPDPGTPPPTVYEVRRVYYRYSWDGSVEVELTGEDREVAEAFARRVVPELG